MNFIPASIPRIKLAVLLLAWIAPPILKKPLYKLVGYRFGKRVDLGWFSALFAHEADIADRVSIGHFSLVCGKRIKVGEQAIISAFCWFYGNGSLTVGRFCYVGFRSVINNYDDFSIGDLSSLGAQSTVYTHGSWLPYADGEARRYGPVAIGTKCWVQARVVIGPAVKIGDGAMVITGSVVMKSVPPTQCVAGVPAKIIGRAAILRLSLNAADVEERILEMIKHYASQHGYTASSTNDWLHPTLGTRIIFLSEGAALPSDLRADGRTIALCANSSTSDGLRRTSVSWFDFSRRMASPRHLEAERLYYFIRSHYGEYFTIEESAMAC